MKRPFGISLLAALSFTAGLTAGGIGLTEALGNRLVPMMNIGQAGRAFCLLGTVLCASAWGLFKLRNWARVTSSVSCATTILAALLGVGRGAERDDAGVIVVGTVVAAALFFVFCFLNTPAIKRIFARRRTVRPRPVPVGVPSLRIS